VPDSGGFDLILEFVEFVEFVEFLELMGNGDTIETGRVY